MKKIILSLMLIVSSIFASEISDLESYFNFKLKTILTIVQDKSLDKKQRDKKIIENLNDIFDFELMGKLSLGKRVWVNLSKDKQKEFIKLYIKRMQKSYSSKLDSYKDQKVEINAIKQIKSNRIILDTNIISPSQSYKVSYKFYKPRKQKDQKYKWLIYDVNIMGVSVLKNDIVDFKEFLTTHTIEQLMDKMRTL